MSAEIDFDRALVVGLGVTGEAVAEVLCELGIEVRVSEFDDTPELRDRADTLRDLGVEVGLGGHDRSLIDWADIVLPSKGISPSNALLSEAIHKGLSIWSEFELAWQLGARSIIAVTGTNGKTTTTTLLSRILEDGGVQNVAAGNLPVPLIKAVSLHGEDALFICEASSFGLAFIRDFRPFIGIALNVGDDHYDWHRDHTDYLAAKARITENQVDNDLLIVNGEDLGCRSIASSSLARIGVFGLGTPDEIASKASRWGEKAPGSVGGLAEGRLVLERADKSHIELPIDNIRLQGRHNLENILGATLAAMEMGIEEESIARTLSVFEGLPHRMSFVSEVGGVRYIDDSKATNPHATLRALDGLNDVILIAGGRDKDLDLSVIASLAPRLVGVVGMGEAASRVNDIFRRLGLRVEIASDVEEAVRIAAGMARSGDTVLLSPACSSLDQYSGYEERGDKFVKAVKSL